MEQTIKDIAAHLEDLPLHAVFVSRIMLFNRDDDAYFGKVLPVARQDPAVMLPIIRLVSSNALRLQASITDLNTAIACIGACRTSALQLFVPGERDARSQWLHSIQVAVVARIIALKYLQHRVGPAEAYLYGLMQDIGLFIMFDVAAGEISMERFEVPGLRTD